MKNVILLLLVSSALAAGCASKSTSTRSPQATSTGNGSIGSGSLDIQLGKVISALTLDFNGDGEFDRALLMRSDDGDTVDLYIIFSVYSPNPQTYIKPSIAYDGTSQGMIPSLAAKGENLKVFSENTGVGRLKWQKTITLSFRKNEILVSGLTLTESDSLSAQLGGTCDVNFLTGQGVFNGKPIKTGMSAVTLDKWELETRPKECAFKTAPY